MLRDFEEIILGVIRWGINASLMAGILWLMMWFCLLMNPFYWLWLILK